MNKVNFQFVEYIPKYPEQGILYISLRFKTIIHRCACGCGNKTVTKLSPTDWKLLFDGVNVSLYPSIGNWSFPCQSHYWISENRVEWAEQWTQDEIINNRILDKERKTYFFSQVKVDKSEKNNELISKKKNALNKSINAIKRGFCDVTQWIQGLIR